MTASRTGSSGRTPWEPPRFEQLPPPPVHVGPAHHHRPPHEILAEGLARVSEQIAELASALEEFREEARERDAVLRAVHDRIGQLSGVNAPAQNH